MKGMETRRMGENEEESHSEGKGNKVDERGRKRGKERKKENKESDK